MTLSMGMSFVRSPSYHASYLLGTGADAIDRVRSSPLR